MIGSGGIDQQIAERQTQFKNDPKALQKSYSQDPQLITLLALEDVRSKLKAAQNEKAMQLGKQPSVRQQLEKEVMGLSQNQIAESLGIAGQQQQQRQQQAMQQMAQGPGAQQPAGIQSLSPKKFSQGGIVKLAGGETVPSPEDDRQEKLANPSVQELITRYGYSEDEALEQVYNKGFAKMGKGIASILNGMGERAKTGAADRRVDIADRMAASGADPERVALQRSGLEHSGTPEQPQPAPASGDPFGMMRSDANPTPPADPFGMMKSDGNPEPQGIATVANTGGSSAMATSSPAMMAGIQKLDPNAEAAAMGERYDRRMKQARDADAMLVKEADKRDQWMREDYDPQDMARQALWASLAGLGTGGGRIGVDFANSVKSGQGSMNAQKRRRMEDQAGLESLMTGNRTFAKDDGEGGFNAEKGGYDKAITTNTDRDKTAAQRERDKMLAEDSKAWRYLEVYRQMMGDASTSRRQALADIRTEFEAQSSTQQLRAQVAKAQQEGDTAATERLQLQLQIEFEKALQENRFGDVQSSADEVERTAREIIGPTAGIPNLTGRGGTRNPPSAFTPVP